MSTATAHRPAPPGARRRGRLRLALASGLVTAAVAAGIVVAAGPGAAATAPQLTPAERAWLAAHGPIRLAPDPSFPPLEWFDDDGTYRGLVADWFRIIQARLGTRIEFVRYRTWDEVLQRARAGEVDGVTAAQQTPDRSAFLVYTPPIIDVPNVIVVRTDVAGTLRMQDLAGRRVAVTSGNALHEYVREQFPGIALAPQRDDLACLDEVSFGRADATVVNLAIASYLIERHGISNLRVAGDSGRRNPLAIAIRSDRPVLRDILAKGLASVTPAERDAIRHRWIRLGEDAVRLPPGALVALAVAAGVLLLGAAAFVGWNAVLRREVARATAGLQAELAERRRAEAALRRSEEKLKLHLEQTLFAVIEWDLELRPVYWNPAAERIFGWTRAEALGRPAWELLVPASAEAAARAAWRDLLRRPGTSYAVNENVTRDGRLLTCEWYDTALRDADGRTIGVISLVADVTARRRAEAEVAAEKERLAVTLRSIGDAVIATDTGGRIQLFNGVAEKLTGWRADDVTGEQLRDVLVLEDPRTRERLPDAVARVLRDGDGADAHRRALLVARDGRERVVIEACAPIRDGGGTLGAVLVLRDVTALEQREEALARTQRLESLALAAGGIAHDFNNLLTGILANLSVALDDDPPPPDAPQLLREAEAAARRARALTQQLLTFSKGGAPVKQLVALPALVEEAARFAARGTRCVVGLQVAEDVWSAELDPGQLAQVIHNLVVNAAEAAPEGASVTIGLANERLEAGNAFALAPGPYVRVTVTDRGPGIPEAIRSRLFDPFFSTKQRGSGLGLAVSHSIVTRHGGHIGVRSRPGEGATFTLLLPARPGARAGEERAATPAGAVRCRLLVMDDDDIIRRAAARVFAAVGCEVATAADGAEAVERYREALAAGRRYDVVILDLTVPGGLGGANAVARLRALDPDVRAVVSSGYSDDPVMSEHRRHGFVAVLHKPFGMIEARAVVVAALAAGAGARPEPGPGV